MTDLVEDPNNTYGDSHDWDQGESYQWGKYGGRAQTPWRCRICKVHFIHYYHDQPNIRQAMRDSDIPDQCEGNKNDRNQT